MAGYLSKISDQTALSHIAYGVKEGLLVNDPEVMDAFYRASLTLNCSFLKEVMAEKKNDSDSKERACIVAQINAMFDRSEKLLRID